MDKKRIIIFILIFIVALLCIAIGVVSISRIKSPEKISETDNYKSFNTIDISGCSHKKCDNTFEFNNNKISIVVDDQLNYQIRYNKKVIWASTEYPYLGDKIYTFDDKLLYFIYNNENSFYDVVYDPSDSDFQKFTLMEDDPNWIYKEIKVSENTITFETDRFLNDTDFVDVEAHNMLPITSCDNFRKYENYEAAKTFVITYENGKFSDASNTKTLLLKDYKNYKDLCN